jgi:hypothetical protein
VCLHNSSRFTLTSDEQVHELNRLLIATIQLLRISLTLDISVLFYKMNDRVIAANVAGRENCTHVQFLSVGIFLK